MTTRNVASVLRAKSSQLQPGMKSSNVLAAFGAPEYMGASLDNLQSPGSAAVPMPGIALGEPAEQVAQVAMGSGETKTLPISKNEPQSQQYYIAYEANDNKVLWFKVKVGDNGDEVLADHGLKDKSSSSKKD
ncbi:hypothetical protein GGI03_001981 [Coemansia sp. RSA 2337]|nr:hypothetical protein GGI03_001981 [Coemansia sp. RSA 2337]